IEQSGEKRAAAALYREIMNGNWPKNQRSPLHPSVMSIGAEAAGYLAGLLDPIKDRDEIETLRKRAMQIDAARPVTPVALALNDGMSSSDLIDWSISVSFD